MVIVEQLVGWRLTGETEVLGGNCPGVNLSTTNPTWPDPDSNPNHCGGKPRTNHFSYGAALTLGAWIQFTWFHPWIFINTHHYHILQSMHMLQKAFFPWNYTGNFLYTSQFTRVCYALLAANFWSNHRNGDYLHRLQSEDPLNMRKFSEFELLLFKILILYLFLQPFVGPWPLLQFRNHFYTDGRAPWTSD
jgi:hypothetical protein